VESPADLQSVKRQPWRFAGSTPAPSGQIKSKALRFTYSNTMLAEKHTILAAGHLGGEQGRQKEAGIHLTAGLPFRTPLLRGCPASRRIHAPNI